MSRYNAPLMEPNSTFKYTPGGNAQSIWRKHGWVPPTEYREDYLFKQNREGAEGEKE
jgi:hypothetical protein